MDGASTGIGRNMAEIEPLGVHVSVIDPGNYDSAISASAKARSLRKIEGYQKEGSPFAEQFREWTGRAWDRSQCMQSDEVSAAALHAVFDERPLRRYRVVPNAEEADGPLASRSRSWCGSTSGTPTNTVGTSWSKCSTPRWLSEPLDGKGWGRGSLQMPR